MHVETVVAGFGGQGILFLGRVLATAGMIEGYHVSWFPSYGPEMRGGTAYCVVIISDQEIGSTLSDHPNICIVMNEPSLRRYAPSIKPGGLLVINSSLITQHYKDPKIQILEVPGNDIAGNEIGDPRTLNMVILGALIGYHSTVKDESIRQALEEILSGKKRELIDVNMKAFYAGKNSISSLGSGLDS